MSFEVQLVDVSYRFGTSVIFNEISAVIPGGSELVITGKSGSGKSTLLELAAGVVPAQRGSVIWDGHDLATASRTVVNDLELRSAVVFQQHALISYLPLFENIALPLRHHRRGTREEINDRVSTLMERLNLTAMAWHLPEALAEGQKRLGSIARALAIEPELLCMDEPTGGLDDEQRAIFLPIYDELVASESVTLIVATADPELLTRPSSVVISLSASGGNQ